MSIRIDRGKCVGCGGCAAICPGNLIGLDSGGKPFLKRPEDCWGCCACLKECPVRAVCLVLDPQLGGNGETLSVKREGTRSEWEFTDRNGRRKRLTTDTKRANAY